MKQPFFKFFPSDWRSDPALRSCSLGARGLWMEMICLMHEAEPRGYLSLNGRPASAKQLANLCGVPLKEVSELLAELEEAGVFSRDDDDRIFSRRMRREAEKSEVNSQNGKQGGRPRQTDHRSGDKASNGATIKQKRSEQQSEKQSERKATREATREANEKPYILEARSQNLEARETDNPASELPTARARARSPEMDLRIAIVDAYREAGREIPPETGHCAVWIAQGYPPDLCLSVIRSKLPGACDKGLKWFDKAIAEAFAKRASGAVGALPVTSAPEPPSKRRIWSQGRWIEKRPEFEPPIPEALENIYPFERADGREDGLIEMPGGGYRWESQYRAHLRRWVEGSRRSHLWREQDFGADPRFPSCRAPDDLLAEFGLERVPYPSEDDEVAA